MTGSWNLCSMLALLAPVRLTAQNSPTAATPPMGWNSWNHFAERVTEADVCAAADALVASGMRDALADFKGKHLLDLWTRKEIVLDAITALRVPSHSVLLLEQR